MKKTDVLIIGGGVIGVCTAYYLAMQGREVTIVEKGEVGAACSYGNAGLIVPSHSIPLAAPGVLTKGLKWMLDPASPFFIKMRLDRDFLAWLWRFQAACKEKPMRQAIPVLRDLSLMSTALFDELLHEEQLACDYEQRGMLMVFQTDHGLEEGIEEANLLQEYDLATTILDGAQLHEMEPALRSDLAGAVYFPTDAHLNPALFVSSLANRAQRQGVTIHTGTEVLALEVSRNQITTVKTTHGDYQANQVVLAAGAWVPRVAHDLKINLPIQPAKGYSLTLKLPENGPRIPMILSETKVAVNPMGPLLRLGGTLELVGLDLSINQRRVEAVRRSGDNYFNFSTDDLETVEIWRGLRPCTPDGLPIIGRSSVYNNLVIAAGHAMLGVSLGPATGQLVSQVICGETPDVSLDALSIERF